MSLPSPPLPSSSAADELPLPDPGGVPSFPRRWALVPALGLIALALTDWLGGYDRDVFAALNGTAARLPPALWAALSLCGSVLGTLALLAPTLKTQPRWLASALLAAPLGTLFSVGGKRYFDVMRPAGVLEAGSFTQIGQKLYVHAFPSGHATTAFLVAAVLILAWPKAASRPQLALCVFGVAALVALSRIAVGAHWPLDVLVGASGGWLCGSCGVWLSGRLSFWQKPGGVRAMAAIALGASLALLFVDLGYPLAHLWQTCLAAWGIGGAASALTSDARR